MSRDFYEKSPKNIQKNEHYVLETPNTCWQIIRFDADTEDYSIEIISTFEKKMLP